MAIDPVRIEEVFTAALASPPEQRSDYLDEACAGQLELRARVDELLVAHEKAAGSFLSPTISPGARGRLAGALGVLDAGPAVEAGAVVGGKYKLLELIGEGGFGSVFMAEQQRPIRRRVAVKIIKLGMDTKQVIARFEAERQALAMMDHPHIAKVLDAGATEGGRPYFVMELVRGVPVTEYCDQTQASVAQRLELFVQVCQAVQHAHQKGVVHRDIKPSNVLVATQDDRAIVKVIDFGIAKAVDRQLTERSLFTEFRQMIGTPEYMSPEQAGGGLDVDTRADVYSLGVLMYELLTGTTPFDARELRGKAYDELQRVIREVDPPKPSTRLSTMGGLLPGVAALRHVEPAKLGALLRGDLDWIVMKALEKDRARRYATANDLAADVARHLSDEVVTATPPGAAYRVSKFVRRNRLAVVTSGVVASSLLAGLVASGVMYRRERAAHWLAEAASANETVQRQEAEASFRLAKQAVDRITDIAQNQLDDPGQLATVRRDMLEDAAKFYEMFARSRESDPAMAIATSRTHRRAAELRSGIGQPWEAETHDLRAIALMESASGKQPERADLRDELGFCYLALGRLYHHELADPVGAEKAYRRAKELFQRTYESDPENTHSQSEMFWGCMELSWILLDCDRDAEAMQGYQQALKIGEHLAGGSPQQYDWELAVGQAKHRIGACFASMGNYGEAEAYFRASLVTQGRQHAADPKDEWVTYNYTATEQYLGGMLKDVGRPTEGETLIRQALDEIAPIASRRSEYTLMATHLAYAYEGLGNCLFAEGRLSEAHDAYVRQTEGLRRVAEAHPDAPSRVLGVLYPLALCQDASVRDPAAAASLARTALKRSPRNQRMSIYLGASLYQMGDWEGAVNALEAAQQDGPNDLGFARYILALALFRSGRVEVARQSMAEAEHWASSTPVRFHEPRFFAIEARRLMGTAGSAMATSQP